MTKKRFLLTIETICFAIGLITGSFVAKTGLLGFMGITILGFCASVLLVEIYLLWTICK